MDASAAYEILHVYYHATVHRRAVVPLKQDRGQHLHLRSNALETVSTLRELFDLNGWPTGQLESPRYVFLRWEAAKIEKGTWHDHLLYACADFRRNVQSFC